MPTQEHCHTLNQAVNQLRPTERVTRKRNFVWLLVGLYQSYSVYLHNFLRLSRLTLAVMLLYVWLIVVGTRDIKNGQRCLVDRNDHRDYSIFRIGCNLIERFLSNGQLLSFSFVF